MEREMLMKLTEEKIKNETYYSTMYYENMKKSIDHYEKDPRKKARLDQLLCKTCFYLKSGIAGQAFTNYSCRNCGKESSHPNTNTPKYCHQCGEENSCCVRCASKL